MRKALLVMVPIVLLAAGAVGASYLIRTKAPVEPSPPVERVWTADAVPVRLTDIQPQIQLFGKIFAARELQLRALVPGQVVELHPDLVEGGLVRRSEPILAIDEFEYRSALKESEARLAETRARIVEREARRLAETEALLRASFDGVFQNVAVQVGQRLSVNDRVGNLIDTGRLEARFHISDAQYGRLTSTSLGVIGRKARVIWRVGQREVVLNAAVARVGAQIDAASGGGELFAHIEDRDAASSLRPGAFVEVLIPDRTYANVARVPETVLHPGNVVYGVEDGRLVPRRAEIVGRAGNDVLLRGELSDGERLVTTQSVAIAPGLRVELR